jgi:2-polyprenyl-3-methyl-5-hydroxy-6-metoxy-1,4-benzoquinol methylase
MSRSAIRRPRQELGSDVVIDVKNENTISTDDYHRTTKPPRTSASSDHHQHHSISSLSSCSNRTKMLMTSLCVLLCFVLLNFSSSIYEEQDVDPQDMSLKYDVLSSWVKWSNQLIWSSSTGHETMHQAIGNPPNPHTLDVVVLEEALHRIDKYCKSTTPSTTSSSSPLFRVFDAGSGWGGTSFELEKGITQKTSREVHVDGVTLSSVQCEEANSIAKERRIQDRVQFHLKSFDDGRIQPQYDYDLTVSIEAIVHSRNIANTLEVMSSFMKPNDKVHCSASHFLIVEDIFVSSPQKKSSEVLVGDPSSSSSSSSVVLKNTAVGPTTTNSYHNLDNAVVDDYKKHWVGWVDSPFPLSESQWREHLVKFGKVSPSTINIVDLGEEHGLRLHHPISLFLTAKFLSFSHFLVSKLFPFQTTSLESYLSTYMGAIARERLLVEGTLRYALISASVTV